MHGGWSVSRCGATFLAVTRREATVKRSTYSTDLRCDCFGEGHSAPVSLWKGEGNTHSTHKNNTVALINKIRVTTATQLGVHVEEDEDRTSRGVKTQAGGRARGRKESRFTHVLSRLWSAAEGSALR